MTEILKLRIDRTRARRDVPFDIVYLIPRDNPELVPKLFLYALHLINLKNIKRIFDNIYIDERELIHTQQPRSHSKLHYKECLKDHKPDWTEAYTMLVPIRPIYSVSKLLVPSYLLAKRHVSRRPDLATRFSSLLEDAELVSPQGRFKPLCIICPRQLFYLRDACHLGSSVCLSTLAFCKRGTNE